MKAQKGITLVALVITIIVLLILAMVSISIITDSNLIGHAENGVNAYNAAQYAENQTINAAETYMNQYYNS